MNAEEVIKSTFAKRFKKSFLVENHVKEKQVLKKNATCIIVLVIKFRNQFILCINIKTAIILHI